MHSDVGEVGIDMSDESDFQISSDDEAILGEVKKIFIDELVDAMGRYEAERFAGIYFDLPLMRISPHETVAHMIVRKLRQSKP